MLSVAKRKLKVAVVIPLWKRHKLASAVLASYGKLIKHFSDRIIFYRIAVGSEGSVSKGLALDNGFHYVEHTNTPVWKKWNRGIQEAKNFSPDYLWPTGDDELTDTTLIEHYLRLALGGHHFIGTVDEYFWEPASNRAIYFKGYDKPRIGEPIGPWRWLSSEIMDKLGWECYDSRAGSGSYYVDGSCYERIGELGEYQPTLVNAREIGAYPVGMKVGFGLTPFEAYNGETIDANELIQVYPEFNRQWLI